MNAKPEILTMADVKLLVDTFYGKVRQNPALAPVFDERIKDRWSAHLEKMYRFWQTVLLDERTYFGSPFMPHADLPVDGSHFAEWMELFTQAVNELFSGEKANEAIWRAGKMAEMFRFKLAAIKNGGFRMA